MKISASFGFYAILTDPVCGYERLTEICVEHGVAFLQLRMKEAPEREVLAVAKTLRRLSANTTTRLIVNDYPHVAADAGADGVHVGQGDMPYDEARRIVGPDAIVGISTHSPEQTRVACAFTPDYVGIGPVFATPTKKVPDPPIGIDGMKEMLSIATVPAVVLGSVTLDNLPEILEAGARNFSMVRPLNRTTDPARLLHDISELCARYFKND